MMRQLRQERAPTALCPKCGEMVSGWSETGGGRRPKAGDAAICLYCLEVLTYDASIRPVLPTPEEAAEFAADPRIQNAVKALRAAKLESAIFPPSKSGLMPKA